MTCLSAFVPQNKYLAKFEQILSFRGDKGGTFESSTTCTNGTQETHPEWGLF